MLGVGGRYEFMLNRYFSVGVNGYWNNLLFFWHDWGITAAVRFYPWRGVFFMELGLGYTFHSGFDDYEITVDDTVETGSDWVGAAGFGIIPGIGWKISPGKNNGFFIQPGIKLPITIGNKKPIINASWIDRYPGKFGSSVGFITYCGFGYAF